MSGLNWIGSSLCSTFALMSQRLHPVVQQNVKMEKNKSTKNTQAKRGKIKNTIIILILKFDQAFYFPVFFIRNSK